VRRRLFWPLIVIASLLVALGAASFAAALFSDPLSSLPTQVSDVPYGYTEIFGRVTSLDWSSDRGFLIAAISFEVSGIAIYVAAARRR